MYKIDIIKFKFEVENSIESDGNELRYSLYIRTLINNEALFEKEKIFLNLPYLENALHKTQEFPIFVCGCGDEGCAGIFKTPRIINEKEYILWKIYEPHEQNFRFKKGQFFKALDELKQSMLDFCGLNSWKKVAYIGVVHADEFFNKKFLAKQRAMQKSRKVFKSIAHNYAQYFFSDENYASNIEYVGDYVCNELLVRKEKILFYDILSHKMKPEFLLENEYLTKALFDCSENILYYLLRVVGFENGEEIIKKATMLVRFFPEAKEEWRIPFEARVRLVDEYGKSYEGKFVGFCLEY